MPIRFNRLDLYEVRIPFRFSFSHSLASRDEANSLILVLHTNRGEAGYGEVVPRGYLTGESTESAWHDICKLWWPQLKEITTAPATDHVHGLLDKLEPLYEQADSLRRTASYAGIDIAAVDAFARACGIPGSSLFGQNACSMLHTGPIGAMSINKTAWVARILLWILGYRDFKIKLGRDDDLKRVKTVRRIIGDYPLRADANAAWDVEQAIKMVRELKQLGIVSIEQPVRADDIAGMARVQTEGGLPVMADESLCTREDGRKLLDADAAKLWNVRLAKIGGFSGMINLIRMAKDTRLHLGVLVGETELLTAAQRACSGLAEFAHVEYAFSAVLLKKDPFKANCGGAFGSGEPLGNQPGLGVKLRYDILEKITVRRCTLT